MTGVRVGRVDPTQIGKEGRKRRWETPQVAGEERSRGFRNGLRVKSRSEMTH